MIFYFIYKYNRFAITIITIIDIYAYSVAKKSYFPFFHVMMDGFKVFLVHYSALK